MLIKGTRSLITLAVLTLFSLLERYIDKVHHDRLLEIGFTDENYENLVALENMIQEHHLTFRRWQINKHNGCLEAALLVTGHKKHVFKLDERLLKLNFVKSFQTRLRDLNDYY